MGRSRGRGRFRNSGRGRGGGAGGGYGQRKGRAPYPDSEATMSRKDIAHISQFGEKHPSHELDQNFGPSAPEKRGKFVRGRGRGFSRNQNNFSSMSEPGTSQQNLSSSDSSEDEETTPYNELLSVFTGKKQKVQIVSESEEESEAEISGLSDGSSDEGDDGEVYSKRLEGAADDLDSDSESSSLVDTDSDEQKEPDANLENSLDQKDFGGGEREKGRSKQAEIQNPEMDEGDNLGDENTVIEDAELDPEMNNLEGQFGAEVDPFILHFEREMSNKLQKEIKKDNPSMITHNIEWPHLEKFTFTGVKDPNTDDTISSDTTLKINLSELDGLPEVRIQDPPLEPLKSPTLDSLHIKSQLHTTIPIANQENIDKNKCSQPLTPLQEELMDLASRYVDMYFPLRTINNAEEIRLAYCLHVANHVLKTRTRILHHNAKLGNKSEVPNSYRDQGFVRPRVLILAPFKDSAFRIVKLLISLILKEEKGNVANKKRFMDEYGGETLFMPKTNPKPADYIVTFNGNVDDNFKLGMAVTKKSIKLYTGFYSSDIIIASPLGLRMIVGADGEKDRDYDFLSSIEVLILDQADVFLMQNWDHILHLLKHLHLQPVTTHGTDFARIRPWALDNLSKFYCQTLIFSSVACPEHSSLMTKYCKNYAGQARIVPVNLKGSIGQVTVQLPQVFQKFETSSIGDVDDARFEYFKKHVLPNFSEKLMSHTLIFVSSYFDFVRLRNYFRKEEVSFVQICEYSKDKKIARARDLFFHGSNHFMFYTERAHFFRRFRLKGIGHIIFYQLPQNPQFYPELCNYIQEGFQNKRVRRRKNSSVNVIYCKYDTPRLAAVVGVERAGIMLSSEKNVHAFVSGDF